MAVSEVLDLSNTDLDMRVVFIIPEEDNLEIPTEIPSVPTIDSCVSFNGQTLYLVSTIVHIMIDGNYEATCGLKKIEKSEVKVNE
jgi:hypothetical protein